MPQPREAAHPLPELLEHAGITAKIVLRDIPDGDSAVKERFLGSPTVRLNGRDVDPAARQRDDYGMKCRLYHTPTCPSGLPPDQWILDAIAAHQAAGIHALD
jgi:hypothetical protein